MPAPISFGARTGRDNNYVGVQKEETFSIGPGTYHNIPQSITQKKPSYAPFGSTAKRKFTTPANSNLTPSPMTYDPKPVNDSATPGEKVMRRRRARGWGVVGDEERSDKYHLYNDAASDTCSFATERSSA